MDLIKFLKENKDSRKIFGKREIIIIEKQVNGINLTQSEKNRLSRDIRVKLRFIEEGSRFKDEFKLKKGAMIKKLIEEIKEEILNDKFKGRIQKIWVFGSFIENTMSFRSDIDIAVKFNKINLKEATLFRIRLSGKSSDKIDVQVYNILPDKIKKEIDKKGSIIYENK